MSFKIKDLLRIIKEAQQREAHLEELDSKISGYIDERGHLKYDPEGCAKDYSKAKDEYEDWINRDLEIEPVENSTLDIDTREHVCNMKILEALKEYLDDNRTIRFGQALVNLGIITNIHGRRGTYAKDPFYERPEDTYKRMRRENEDK